METTSFRVHADTHTGPVHLAVSDLERSLRFYQDVIGFSLLAQHDGTAALTADDIAPLLLLTEQPNARARPPRTSGLYHFAILMPSRAALARSLRRLADTRWPLGGASDHLVSEALYLSDPDGIGIELYRDRPREEWPFQGGSLVMGTAPLDLQDLLGELRHADTTWQGLDPHTVIGHVHLNVSHLEPAVAFYQDALGLDLMVRYGPSTAFLSAGGYHHHLGLNTWTGVGAPQPPADAVGLHRYTLLVPDEAEQERLAAHLEATGLPFARRGPALLLHDPSHNEVAILPHTANLLNTLTTL